MSPILKRDISEQIRQAKRLAAAATGRTSTLFDTDDTHEDLDKDYEGTSYAGFSSSSSARQGIGVDQGDIEGDYQPIQWEGLKEDQLPLNGRAGRKGKGKARAGGISKHALSTPLDLDGDDTGGLEDGWSDSSSAAKVKRNRLERMGFEDVQMLSSGPAEGKWKDLRSLLFESTPSLLLSLIGLVFTGELLEHLARWRVFRRVDELFILVPMIGNLKGNLEMCLSARLGTSANIGELDERKTRKTMLLANMTLLGLQALLISCLAAVLSFGLGLVTEHRLGDAPIPSSTSGMGGTNMTFTGTTGSGEPDAGLAVGEVEWHEGYTRPGWKQLVMVLATGMGAAGISSAVLGSFMGSLIILSRWAGLDPDNITPPVAACLGDLLTLFILALLGSLLVGTMDTLIPLLAVIVMSIAAGWFTRRVMRNEWIKNVARGSWLPLIGAMLISSGTGMVLDKGVAKYRGFALLAISMTGLTGSIGAIHANRLSTLLHTRLHPPHPLHPPQTLHSHHHTGLTPTQSSITLYLIAFPCQAAFILFVNWAGWIDLSLSWAGWMAFALTTSISLALAHFLTLFFWSKSLDPDSYTLPIHSALVDFIGQLLLMIAYEICIFENRDVLVKEL